MVVSRNNEVVGLVGISNKKMCELLFGPQQSARNKGVVVWRGSTVQRLNKVLPYLTLITGLLFSQILL